MKEETKAEELKVEPREEVAPSEAGGGKDSEKLPDGDTEGTAAPDSVKQGGEEVQQSRRVYIGDRKSVV